MYENIGAKLKSVAMFFCVLGMIVSGITGIAGLFRGQIMQGLLMILVGCVSSWLGGMAFYGFGELIERAVSIDQKLGGTPASGVKSASSSFAAAPRNAESQAAEEKEKILAAGGWQCRCGKVNYPYVTTCTCGKRKWESAAKQG